MKGKSKTQKGITLIALIITIVVLLILAVVAIDAIQDDGGILAHAQNAAGTYNNAVANEQASLANYLEYLTGANKSFKEYTVGQTVTLKNGDVNEEFCVIADSDASQSKVTLIAKQAIIIDKNNEKYLTQSSNAYPDMFSETIYWLDGSNIKSEYAEIKDSAGSTVGYDLTETGIPDETHYAAYAAYQYGKKFGVTTIGRLLSYTEAESLIGYLNSGVISSFSTGTYISAAVNDSYGSVYLIEYWGGGDYGLTPEDWEKGKGTISPVIEISKSSDRIVTE